MLLLPLFSHHLHLRWQSNILVTSNAQLVPVMSVMMRRRSRRSHLLCITAAIFHPTLSLSPILQICASTHQKQTVVPPRVKAEFLEVLLVCDTRTCLVEVFI